jgi:hypothetical protein
MPIIGSAYYQQVQNTFGSSLIAYWTLGDTSGSVAYDSSGNGRNAIYSNATLDQPGKGDGKASVLYNGTTSFTNIYTTSFKNAFSGSVGTIGPFWFRTSASSVWIDGSIRYFFNMYAGGSDQIYIQKSNSASQINVIYKAGGTNFGRAITGIITTNWQSIAFTWDKTANEARTYFNGIQYGDTQKSLTTWGGTMTTWGTAVGAFRTDAVSNVWNGYIQHFPIGNRALNPTEIAYLGGGRIYSVPLPSPESFSVVYIPDTGNSVPSYPTIFTEQTQWIVDNKDNLNIKAVLHSGDVINTVTNASEWTSASAAVSILDAANIPYLIGLGNHDYNTSARVATSFNGTFPQSLYTIHSWWNGEFYELNHSENSYFTQTINGIDYLFMNLEIAPRSAVITWANTIISANPSKRVIISTHAYMYYDGTRIGPGDDYDPKTFYGYTDASDGEDLWNNLVKLHDNIIWIQSGHEYANGGASRRQDLSNGGSTVSQILADFESISFGGNGYLRVVQFNPSSKTVNVYTFSPVNKQMLVNDENQFIVNY